MTAIFIVSEPPHGYHALRLAGSLSVDGHHACVFPMAGAIWAGVAGPFGANAYTNRAARSSALLGSEAEVETRGLGVETCGVPGPAMLLETRSRALPDPAEWVAGSNRVLTF